MMVIPRAMYTTGITRFPARRQSSPTFGCAVSQKPAAHHTATITAKVTPVAAEAAGPSERKSGMYTEMLSPPLATVTATTTGTFSERGFGGCPDGLATLSKA